MKKLVAVCMALVMALGLAACGGSGSSSSAPAASSGAVSAPAASGTSASEADDGIAMTGGNVEEHSVEAIKAKGVLVVTTEAGYAPFEFLDENDNVVGLDASWRRRWQMIWALNWIYRTSRSIPLWLRSRRATPIWPSRALRPTQTAKRAWT